MPHHNHEYIGETVRIRPDEQLALVLLNGRRIVCIEADDEEGWVDVVDTSNIPSLEESTKENKAGGVTDHEDMETVVLGTKRLTGKVQIFLPKKKNEE